MRVPLDVPQLYKLTVSDESARNLYALYMRTAFWCGDEYYMMTPPYWVAVQAGKA